MFNRWPEDFVRRQGCRGPINYHLIPVRVRDSQLQLTAARWIQRENGGIEAELCGVDGIPQTHRHTCRDQSSQQPVFKDLSETIIHALKPHVHLHTYEHLQQVEFVMMLNEWVLEPKGGP